MTADRSATVGSTVDATDRNCLSFWFPRLEIAASSGIGLRIPRTRIVSTSADMVSLLDGETPDGWDDLVGRLAAFGDELGWPCFLRTGHGSGKHEWDRTCFVASAEALSRHVGALVEWSHLVDFFGLPTRVWVMREMIPTEPLFVCDGFNGFPVTREFRVFVRDGQLEHLQPYWPPAACEQGGPDRADWGYRLAVASQISPAESGALGLMAKAACVAVGGGYWSIDFLQDRYGMWWLTDMADGDRSFRWEPED